MVGTGTVDKAAIFNAEGTSVWAASSGFQVSPQELKPIVSSFADSSEPKAIQSSGFHIAGDKYITLRSDDRSLYGKKVCELLQGANWLHHRPSGEPL